jgi:hypothetical protein
VVGAGSAGRATGVPAAGVVAGLVAGVWRGGGVPAGRVGAAGRPGWSGMWMEAWISAIRSVSGIMPRIGATLRITIPAAGAATHPAVAKPWLRAFGFGSSTIT